MDKIIRVNIKNKEEKEKVSNIYEGRKVTAELSARAKETQSEVSVIVLAYNQLEKTKRCVESILKYTNDVDYDLILIDNGSEADMLEYFESINFPKKTIIHIDNNIGAGFPFEIISMSMLSEYVAIIANDVIVTQNWLSNMLKVFESDEKIGIVNPVGSNMSNLQQVNLIYESYEEMQEKAAIFNVSDPSKWQERLRIIALGTVYKKACLYAIGWPMGDVGFFHDFVDDDIAFRARRMGYKVVLARDTWICHDHISKERDAVEFMKSIEQGRADFRLKYHGIDAWDDVNNFIFQYMGNKIKKVDTRNAKILGIDVKCGTPILDIKNMIRTYGIYDAELSAFTRDEKYVEDLKTICDGVVACGREEFITRKFLYADYDYIFIGDSINGYYEPMNVLLDAYMLLKPGGQLIFSLKNTNNAIALLRMLGNTVSSEKEYYYNYPIDALIRDLCEMNIRVSILSSDRLKVADSTVTALQRMIRDNCVTNEVEEMSNRILIDKVWLAIEK